MKSDTRNLFENFQQNLNEKINHANDEVNRVLINPNAGNNKQKIKDMGYETEETSDGRVYGIKNPKTNKWIDPSRYSREEKKKVDFKGKLDSERESDVYNYRSEVVPKSLRVDKGYNGGSLAHKSDIYPSVSKNVDDYKKAVKDRDENRKWAEERRKGDIPYYEKKVKDAQKELEFEKEYTDKLEKDADNFEAKRKEILDKARAKRKTESEKLDEAYSERYGGDPEDFIVDMENLRQYIEEFDMSSFGTHLASQIILSFVETINSQINMTKTKLDTEPLLKDEFNEE